MTPCDSANFNGQHGGLQLLEPDGDPTQNRFSAFRRYFNKLITMLVKPDKLEPETIEELFKVRGYYIGKEQLRCLLDNDFEQYDGLQITLGLSDDPEQATGQVVLLLKGAFPSGGKDRGTIEIMHEDVDLRYFDTSGTSFVAGPPLVGTTPPPNSMPNPPYGDADA